MANACELASWYPAEAAKLASEALVPPAIRDAQLLLTWLQRRNTSSVTAADIQKNGPGQLRNKARLDPAIEVLEIAPVADRRGRIPTFLDYREGSDMTRRFAFDATCGNGGSQKQRRLSQACGYCGSCGSYLVPAARTAAIATAIVGRTFNSHSFSVIRSSSVQAGGIGNVDFEHNSDQREDPDNPTPLARRSSPRSKSGRALNAPSSPGTMPSPRPSITGSRAGRPSRGSSKTDASA